MNAHLPKSISLLLVSIVLTCHSFAQQRTTATDSIVLRYADTTSTHDYYLVKFKSFPGQELLHRHGLVKSLSTQHHILQQAAFDSSEAKQVVSSYRANNNWKCSDALVRILGTLRPQDSLLVQVSFNNTANALQYCRPFAATTSYPVLTAAVKMCDWALFTAQTNVRFVDRLRTARTEIYINNALPSVNSINILQQQYPELQGARHIVGLKEELFDTTDIDLLGKSVPSPLAASTLNPHATIMATLITGLGNSSPTGKGVAPQARISSSDYARLLPDENNYFGSSRITLQNHSYGTGIENYYGAEAAAYDQQVFTLDTVLHIFSSGNIGNTAPGEGTYQGIPGYANLSGTFKQAKNVLVTGGIDTSYNIPVLSSKGPAFDGRISPQLVAYGQSGTSDAAAITTGVATLVQEAYQQEYGVTPSSAMVKAILVNSADETSTLGPDHRSGYGIMNAAAAIRTIKEHRVFTGGVADGMMTGYPLNVPPNTALVKVTLSWNDPAAAENAHKALINDLDLAIIDNAGNRHEPWILSTYPAADSLAAPARHGRDSLNNIEQVSIELPVAGNTSINIFARQLQGVSSQRYALSWQFIPRSSFEWQYPAAGEQLTAEDNIAIRWRTPHTGNGTLSFSADSGTTWTPIATDVPLANNNARWNLPPVFSKGLLRMSTADTTWTSDYFNISSPLSVKIGFNCPDSLMVYWTGLPDVAAYEIYTLKNDVLSRVTTTTDTFLFVPKTQLSSPFVMALPVHKDGWQGQHGGALNYEQQGVDCFFRQVLADVQEDNSVDINVVLSTLYRLKAISWERMQGNSYITLASQNISTDDHYLFKDHPDHSGLFYYRIKLELTDGRIIYSDVQTVQILMNKDFHLFPIPAAQQLTLISSRLGDYQVRFIDMNGRTFLTQTLTQMQQTYSLKGIAPGVYLCVIYEGAKKIFVKRFVKIAD